MVKLKVEAGYSGISRLRVFFLFCLASIFSASSLMAEPSLDKNSVVQDSKTGLIWQKGDSYHELKKGLNWYDALEYVDARNAEKFAGYSDWRLPTMKELNALWSSSGSVKSKDGESLGLTAEFSGGGSYYLWSGDERGLDHAWYFGLGQKENYFNLKDLADLDQGVKMVRNP
jgi:hypothetical protein